MTFMLNCIVEWDQSGRCAVSERPSFMYNLLPGKFRALSESKSCNWSAQLRLNVFDLPCGDALLPERHWWLSDPAVAGKSCGGSSRSFAMEPLAAEMLSRSDVMRGGMQAVSVCGSLRVVVNPAGWGSQDMKTPSLKVFL